LSKSDLKHLFWRFFGFISDISFFRDWVHWRKLHQLTAMWYHWQNQKKQRQNIA